MSDYHQNPLSNFHALQARNASIGHVPSVKDRGEDNRQFGRIRIVVTAGTGYTIGMAGDYVYVESALFGGAGNLDGNPIRAVDNRGNEVYLSRVRSAYVFSKPYNRLQIFNDGSVDADLVLYVGYGRVQVDTQDSVNLPSTLFATGSIIRPNNVTAYAANQLVSNTAGDTFTVFLGGDSPFERGILNSLTIEKSSATIANTHFRLEIYSADPGGLADQSQAPFLYTSKDNYYGAVDIPAFETGGAGSDASWATVSGFSIPMIFDAAGFFFIRLVALEAYVPAANEEFFIRFGYGDGSN